MIKIREKEDIIIKENKKELQDIIKIKEDDSKFLNGWLFIKISSWVGYWYLSRKINRYFSHWKKIAGIKEQSIYKETLKKHKH